MTAVNVRACGVTGIRNILISGERIGRVYRVEKTENYEAHWSGSVTVPSGYWVISEETLRDVRIRVEEAINET